MTNKPFEASIPIFKTFNNTPYKIGEWSIKGFADIDNANNNKFKWHITSMTFTKSELEKHDIDYEDIYVDIYQVKDAISLELHREYQSRLVS